MLRAVPVVSVPVLKEGSFQDKDELIGLLGRSSYISDWHFEHLRETSRRLELDEDRQCRETDPSVDMEGLYIKIEENGCVTERLKYVRHGFFQAVQLSDSHWQARPIVPNRLAIPPDMLFAGKLP